VLCPVLHATAISPNLETRRPRRRVSPRSPPRSSSSTTRARPTTRSSVPSVVPERETSGSPLFSPFARNPADSGSAYSSTLPRTRSSLLTTSRSRARLASSATTSSSSARVSCLLHFQTRFFSAVSRQICSPGTSIKSYRTLPSYGLIEDAR
jgi:hypothetical protein